MRTAPPVSVTLTAGAACVLAVLSLLVAAVAVALAWLASAAFDEWLGPVARAGIAAAVMGLGLAAALPVLRARRRAPARLRWDGTAWWLAEGSRDEVAQGDVRVVADLGGWLLLRCEAGGSGRRGGARVRWLAAHRGGLPGRWHALRCALHAPAAARSAATGL